ncbi:MAG TPA: hypothetical protein VLL54_03435 [Pyrinomonadaceae bacterium]|nr:hypothetical protein [Pyrinomonadaceae bacterium]
MYAVLLSVLGLLGIVFSRFAVEETRRVMPAWHWLKTPFWFARGLVILSGSFFVLFGLLTLLGYLR